jgi:hypothetical protein
MSPRHSPVASTIFFVVALTATASAQAVDEPSVRNSLDIVTAGLDAQPVAGAIAFSTALEVANAPFGSSAGGFVFKRDRTTGVDVRTAPTFGPSFAERALTVGEGKMSFAAILIVATYDKLNDFSLNRMEVTTVEYASPDERLTAVSSVVLSSETLVVSAAIGATNDLDITVAVPFVKVKFNGNAWVENFRGQGFLETVSRGVISSSGLGDIAVGAKYRVLRFGETQPDPGGLAVLLTARLPTGNRENLRGLGIARILGSVVASAGRGRLRPHANVGFEWWEKGLEVAADIVEQTRVTARHQFQYAAGVEFEASPKVTLLVDLLGRHVLGGGAVALQNVTVPPSYLPATSLDLSVATEEHIHKLTLVPGFKWNLKGSFVLSCNALIPIRDNGLHDMFTPVVGLDWNF